jgi:hypothetical protein
MTTTNNNPNIVNQSPYLRTSRDFPEEPIQLSVELERSYIDIAAKMNERIIGIFASNRPSVTGSSWYTSGQQRRQELRQIYIFTSTASIKHGINVINPNQFTGYQGTYTDGTNSYGLIFGSITAIAGQISFYVTATQIIFVIGAGAPSLTSGVIVLSWLSQP